MVTFDDLTYDFQAVGEFVLAESTVAGDSYQVQARLQPYGTSTTISIITQLAAEVGSDRVTFDDTRANIVWIDGTPSTLSAANPTITLNGGTLTELSSNQYQVKWNTGETLTVTNWGPYLQISTQLSPTDGPGSVKGLLGSDTGQANDFQLADGTVIKQPLTTAELYGEFANAWRVTQASSLLDYGTGQTTATFTNLNFPYQPGSLSDFTAAQLAAAAQLVAAAGITDPNVAAAAELDYLETGDTRFISGAVATSQSDPNTTPAAVTPTPTPTPTGFDGDTVTLNGYYGAIISADLDLTGTATVTPDTTTFPSFNALSTGGAIVDGSLTISDNTLTFLYPQSEGGEQFAGGPVNTYVLTDTNPDAPAIVGVTLTSTNIPGLTSSDLTFGAHNVDLNVSGLTLPSSAPGSAVITVDYASPTPTPTGFDGDQITLTAYYGNGLTSGDIIGTGSAMVVPGTTTFPSLAALENGSNGTRLFDGSLTLSGDTMTFLYAPSEEGNMFGSAPANTYDIQTAANDPAITAASLISTNITGLTAADLSFSAHEIDLKVAGLTLPTGVQGSIVLGFSFAGQTTSATTLVAHPST